MLSRSFRNPSPVVPFETLEPRAMLAADLAISVGNLSSVLDQFNNPQIKLPVTVVNTGGGFLRGGADIEFYLSADQELDDSDFLFNTSPLPRMGLVGSPGQFTLNTKLPANLAPAVGRQIPEGEYYVLARIHAFDPNGEANESNNVAATSTKVLITYSFGGSGGTTPNTPNGPLVVDVPGGRLRFQIDGGPGTAQIVNVDNRIVVVVDGTNQQSTLRIQTLSGNPTLSGLQINGNIKNIVADKVSFDGNIEIAGAVSTLTTGNLTNVEVLVAGFGHSMTAKFGNVLNSTFTSNIPLENLTVQSWRDTDATRDTIQVAYINTLKSEGTFEASPTIFSNNKSFAIKKVQIGRDLAVGVWNLTNGGIERFDVRNIQSSWAGTISGTVDFFNINGNASGTMGVGNIRRLIIAGDANGATYLIGARLGADGRLGGTGADADQFRGGRIGVLEIRGRMVDSIIATSLSTTDATLLNGDDRLIAGAGNQIDSITVRRGMTNSTFVAPLLPDRATINFRPVRTQGDARFIEVLPRSS